MNDFRVLVTAAAAFCGLGLASSLSPLPSWTVWAAAAVLGLLVSTVGAVRREIRIRRRLAAIGPLSTPTHQPGHIDASAPTVRTGVRR